MDRGQNLKCHSAKVVYDLSVTHCVVSAVMMRASTSESSSPE